MNDWLRLFIKGYIAIKYVLKELNPGANESRLINQGLFKYLHFLNYMYV